MPFRLPLFFCQSSVFVRHAAPNATQEATDSMKALKDKHQGGGQCPRQRTAFSHQINATGHGNSRQHRGGGLHVFGPLLFVQMLLLMISRTHKANGQCTKESHHLNQKKNIFSVILTNQNQATPCQMPTTTSPISPHFPYTKKALCLPCLAIPFRALIIRPPFCVHCPSIGNACFPQRPREFGTLSVLPMGRPHAKKEFAASPHAQWPKQQKQFVDVASFSVSRCCQPLFAIKKA